MKNLNADFSLKLRAYSTLKTTLGPMHLRALEQIHTLLLQRFAGWPERVMGETLTPSELTSLLPVAPGELLQTKNPEQVLTHQELLQVATSWERADCFVWSARSNKWHRNWDPLVQSWQDFEAQDPTCHAFTLGLDPLCPLSTIQQLLGFMLMQELLQATADIEPESFQKNMTGIKSNP